MTRKALLIGINDYPGASRLDCCVRDVEDLKNVLEFNYDNTTNFNVKTLLNGDATRAGIRKKLKELFSGRGEIALFYFSGHGIDSKEDGYIVAQNYEEEDYGISMKEILQYASNSNFDYKIIILDCCHSGFLGNYGLLGDTSLLSDGIIIMTASRKDESAIEINSHGVFTNLLIEALIGGASDILGNVTPGSIYAFIDQALGPWEQRPLFKANISSFVSLRKNDAKIKYSDLKTALSVFKFEDDIFILNPSFEKTNIKDGPHLNCEPYADDQNVALFKKLQSCNRNGLIIPVDAEDMYFAAMNSKSCKLTPLGKHYWKMIKNKII